MILKTNKRQLSGDAIPITALCDMMFLLLIFFIMTTTLQKTAGFKADIPSGTKGQATQQEKTPTVALHDNKISLNDKPVTLSELRRRVRDMRLHEKSAEGKIVILSAAGQVPYQDYFETMALINNAGGIVAIVREDSK